MTTTTPRTVPNSPFFAPGTPHVVVVQQTPGGTRRPMSVKEEVTENKSGLVGCTANLINAIVGSGIVGIPYAVKQSGFCAGLLLIAFVALLTEKTLRLLISTAKHVHCPSYETAAEAAFGRAGFRFVAINMFVMAYGAMLSYLMIVKDSFSMIFRVEDVHLKRAILVLVSLTIMVPIASQRDMANLAKTSRFSVLVDTLLVALVAINAPIQQSMEEYGGWRTLFTQDIVHWDTVFVGLGVLSFAFVCQHSAFIIAGSLERPTVQRWSIVTASALSLCVMLALTCGGAGYLGYRDQTDGNILNNLDPTSWSANAARAGLGCTMLFVYPLESFVARHVCVVLLFQGRRAHEGDDAAILNRRDRRIGLTLLLYLAAVIPAALFDDLGPVLALTGAISGSCLSYIGPGVVFLGVHGGRFLELVENSWLGSMLGQPSVSSTTISSTKRPSFTMAVETTPLVSTEKKAAQIQAEKEGKENIAVTNEFFVVRALKTLVWWALLMPLWCRVAQMGKRGITSHVHDMALKSPHPIRIGDVEYSRANVRKGRVEADPETAAVVLPPGMILHSDSLPFLADPNVRPLSSQRRGVDAGTPTLNQQIGKNLLQSKKQGPAPEKDPQAVPPGWYDFGTAVFLQLFGMIAFCAGIFSLFVEEET